MYITYAIIDQMDLNSKFEAVEQAHARAKHSEAWKLSNDLSG